VKRIKKAGTVEDLIRHARKLAGRRLAPTNIVENVASALVGLRVGQGVAAPDP
jgi:hypothetical protein